MKFWTGKKSAEFVRSFAMKMPRMILVGHFKLKLKCQKI